MPSTSTGCADAWGPIVDVERTRTLLPADRREIEQASSGRGHQDDGDDKGRLKSGNLAADLYLDELEGQLAELRQRLAALEHAQQQLAAGTYGLSIGSGQPTPHGRLAALPVAE